MHLHFCSNLLNAGNLSALTSLPSSVILSASFFALERELVSRPAYAFPKLKPSCRQSQGVTAATLGSRTHSIRATSS